MIGKTWLDVANNMNNKSRYICQWICYNKLSNKIVKTKFITFTIQTERIPTNL